MAGVLPVRDFSYRTPRVSFPLSFRLEMIKCTAPAPVGIVGINLSAGGIAIEISDRITLNESVELVIGSEDREVARVPGRAFYQSDDHFGFVFEFTDEDQRLQLQQLVSQFVITI